MTINEKRRKLALYRLIQAEEAIDEAKYLLKGGKSARVVINRLYYAMFYAVLGLLVFEDYASSKHSGILAYFNLRFIKPGIFSRELGRSINLAFELRQKADYREFSDLRSAQVAPFVPRAESFVEAVKKNLEASGRI